MRRIKLIVGSIIVTFLIIGSALLVAPRIQQMIEQKDSQMKQEQTKKKIDNAEIDTKEGVWKKILLECSSGEKGVAFHTKEEICVNNGYQVKLNEIRITKKWNRDWDALSPDSLRKEWKMNARSQLGKEYSYVAIDIEVMHKTREKLDSDFSVGNIYLHMFNDKGKRMDAYEVETTNMGKKMYKNPSYCECRIKLGETRKIEIVYICKDADLDDGNHCVLEFALSCMQPNSAEGYCLYRMPDLGEYRYK